jgi:hypothetical protein
MERRTMWNRVKVNGRDVYLCVDEDFVGMNSKSIMRIKIHGPRGFATEGEPETAWREMMRLVGAPDDTPVPSAYVRRADPLAQTPISLPEAEPSCQGCHNPETLAVEAMCASAAAAVAPDEAQAEAASAALSDIEEQPRSESSAKASANVMSEQKTSASDAACARRDDDEELSDQLEDDNTEDEGQEDEDDDEGDDEDDEPRRSVKPAEIFEKEVVRMLQSPAGEWETEAPPKFGRNERAKLRRLATEAEAADAIEDMDRNLDLEEMPSRAVSRDERLMYLERANNANRCEHSRLSGERCAGPALRGQQHCRFHARLYEAAPSITPIEDHQSLRLALMEIAAKVSDGRLNPAQAKVLLQIFETVGESVAFEDPRDDAHMRTMG